MVILNENNLYAVSRLSESTTDYRRKMTEIERNITFLEYIANDAIIHQEEKQTIEEFIEFLEAVMSRFRRELLRNKRNWNKIIESISEPEKVTKYLDDILEEE